MKLAFLILTGTVLYTAFFGQDVKINSPSPSPPIFYDSTFLTPVSTPVVLKDIHISDPSYKIHTEHQPVVEHLGNEWVITFKP